MNIVITLFAFLAFCILIAVLIVRWIDDDIDYRMGVDTRSKWVKDAIKKRFEENKSE